MNSGPPRRVPAGLSSPRSKTPAPPARRTATNVPASIVMAWSVDRLGRSLLDLIGFLYELRAVGCDLYLHQQGVDTATPAGRALFQMLGVFAEFERSIIQERVKAGIARAESQGKHCGRPFLPAIIAKAIAADLEAGVGIRK